jgi:hypothetical protein
VEYYVAFDAAAAGYRDWRFAAGGLPFLAVGVVLLLAHYRQPRARRSRPEGTVLLLFSGFALCWMGGAFAGTWSDYSELRDALRTGRYALVEGVVTDFVPMPKEGHAYERFSVNGCTYRYSDFVVTGAFNNTSSHGGPVREGLRVRIADVRGKIARLEIAR